MTLKLNRILACGVGVQTVAEIIRAPDFYDYYVFADTGNEQDGTYFYLKNYLKPFLENQGIASKFVIVRNNGYLSLLDYCMKNREIPKRQFRWCTDKFKRIPINKFIKNEYHPTMKAPIEKGLGISLDESQRLNMFQREPKYVKTIFPLIDAKITREDCKNIITRAGLPVPPKSGCWFCPYARKEEFRRLKIKDPAKWKQLIAMEKNHPKYPNVLLKFSKPLEDLDFNYSLTDFEEDEFDSCDSGHCFV